MCKESEGIGGTVQPLVSVSVFGGSRNSFSNPIIRNCSEVPTTPCHLSNCENKVWNNTLFLCHTGTLCSLPAQLRLDSVCD